MKLKLAALLAAAVAASVGLSGCVLQSASRPEPVTEIAGISVLVTEPRTVQEFVDEFGNFDGRTDADGARHEYVRAATTFPYALPEGYAFPEEPVIYGENDIYQRGFGASGAFEFWRGATATAAYAASERGDLEESKNLVELYAEGFVTLGETLMDWGDAGEPDLDFAVAPALEGNFGPLRQMEVVGFLDRDVNRQIAIAAGDVIE